VLTCSPGGGYNPRTGALSRDSFQVLFVCLVHSSSSNRIDPRARAQGMAELHELLLLGAHLKRKVLALAW
jgi:hypothetical protein